MSRLGKCKQCGKPFTWADNMANMALGKGGSTNGFCKACRMRFWKEWEKESDKALRKGKGQN